MTVEEWQANYLNALGARLVERLKNDILTKQVTKYGAINATGELYNSIRYEVDNEGLSIYGLDYIYYLHKGRKPGKFPPKDPIVQWVRAKGLANSDISEDSLVYLVRRKIAKEGTTIFQQGGSNLLEDIFNESLVDEIKHALSDVLFFDLRSEILDALT